MLKYLAKISMDVFPSVLATIIGAYIVNHYINARPAADAPAAVVAPAQAGKNGKPADVANLPAPGVKAKGISEKSVTDKPAAEKTADKSVDQPSAEAKAADVAPAETTPRGRPSAREKTVAKSTTTSTPASTPAVAAPATVPVVEANSAPSVAPATATPDANDLARAAIERLRKEDGQSHAQEASRAPDALHLQDAPRTVVPPPPTVSTASVRPLPPPITVVAPPVEGQGNNQGNNQGNPAPYTASISPDNPNRLVPPADIPPPPPIDLRAGADRLATRTNNMAQDVLAKTKSMFHSLLPGGSNGDNGGDRQSSSASQFTD